MAQDQTPEATYQVDAGAVITAYQKELAHETSRRIVADTHAEALQRQIAERDRTIADLTAKLDQPKSGTPTGS